MLARYGCKLTGRVRLGHEQSTVELRIRHDVCCRWAMRLDDADVDVDG